MATTYEPRGPFAFSEAVPLVGEGALLRSRRRRILAIVLLMLMVLAFVLAIYGPPLMWSRNLDLSINAHTGLPDGSYVLEPSTSMHEGDACWFRGPVRSMRERGEVTVAGRGPVQCAGEDYEGRVLIEVVGGTAAITRAGGA